MSAFEKEVCVVDDECLEISVSEYDYQLYTPQDSAIRLVIYGNNGPINAPLRMTVDEAKQHIEHLQQAIEFLENP